MSGNQRAQMKVIWFNFKLDWQHFTASHRFYLRECTEYALRFISVACGEGE